MDKLQEALKEKMEKEHQQQAEIPPAANLPIEKAGVEKFAEDKQLALAESEALIAKQNLDSQKQGYKNYLDALNQFSAERKAFEAEKLKYPDLMNKEKALDEQERDIRLRMSEVENYAKDKKTEGDNYCSARKKEADLYYQNALSKFTFEYNEKNNILKDTTEELQAKIKVYLENVKPSSLLLAKDTNLIINYLDTYIAPILSNGLLKLFGAFNVKLVKLKETATQLYSRIYDDSISILTLSEMLKTKEEIRREK